MTRSPDRLSGAPWLQAVEELVPAYPALEGLLTKLRQTSSYPQAIVRDAYRQRYQRQPGRCALLLFHETHVVHVQFHVPGELAAYFEDGRAEADSKSCRLWILEDLEVEWMEVLGSRVGIDPVVFTEQFNTFNFLDSQTRQTRLPPSMVRPSTWLTLRYFELRQLRDHDAIGPTTNQMTFAINRRRIERWTDIDTPTFNQKWRHIFIRRCASFWTNQASKASGWDAVLLVDPSYESFPWTAPGEKQAASSCTILQDPKTFDKLDQLWAGRGWNSPGSVVAAVDTTVSYHGGSRTLTEGTLAMSEAKKHRAFLSKDRDLGSLLDETVLHWTALADQNQISSTREHAVNAAQFLLKHISNLWVHQLDLMQSTLAQTEYFGDDYQARVDGRTTGKQWRDLLAAVANTVNDMNHLRRQMLHFERHMARNLEHLGVVIGAETVDRSLPAAVQDAQKDFIHFYSLMKPMVLHASSLTRMANELSGLHATFKGIHDSELGLTLSVIASVVFPATLIASILSMGGNFLPGEGKFWIFWATTIPICGTLALMLLFGHETQVWAQAVSAVLKKKKATRRGQV